MNRHSSGSSDEYNNATPCTVDHNLLNGSGMSSNNNNQSSFSSTEQQPPSEPAASQSFSTYADNTSEFYNNNMVPNQMRMYHSMRNHSLLENQMYPMPIMDSMQLNPSSSTNLNHESHTQETESNNTEAVGSPTSLYVPYSHKEAAALMKNLRNKDTYESALQRLITWLLKSEFNKSNSSYLFNLVHSAQTNVWRFMNEKSSFKEKLNQKNLEVSRKKNEIICQLKDICKVYETARLQKVWDQFTKAQRKQISTWMEEAEQIMTTLTEESATDNMDPDENSVEKSSDSSDFHEEYERYKEELDCIRNQLRVAEDENATLQNENAMSLKAYENKVHEIKEQRDDIGNEIIKLKASISKLKQKNTASKEIVSKSVTIKNHQLTSNSSEESVRNTVTKDDVRLIALIVSFLNVHPFGASVEYIWSYLKDIDPKVDCKYVEDLLCSCPQLFKAESRGIGACLTKEWVLIGFGSISKES